MLVRRERPDDVHAIRSIVRDAFAHDDRVPFELTVVDRLRGSDAWLPGLSLVAERDGDVVGQVICSRASVGELPVLALGPIAVTPLRQRAGIGSALVHAVLGAADGLDEPLVVLLGDTGYYPRFGFRPASELGIVPTEPEWGVHLQARTLHAYHGGLRGPFRFAPAFDRS